MTTQTFDPTQETPDAQEATDTERAVFTINSDAAAEWYLQRQANIAAEKARIKTQAARMIAELDADAERLHYLFGGQLADYCRKKIAESRKKRKTVDFFQGRCQFRTVPAAIVVTDQSAAIEYARKHAPQLIKTSEALDSLQYRQIAEKALGDGQTLPGTDRKPEKESFSISFPTTGNK